MSDNAILLTALVILGLPILSYFLTFFFGNKLPRRGDWIGVTLMGVAEFLLAPEVEVEPALGKSGIVKDLTE